MKFSIKKSIEILERTPNVLLTLIEGLSSEWTFRNEGENTWNVSEVVGRLIHGEKTDWIVRTQLILSSNENKKFEALIVLLNLKTVKENPYLNFFMSLKHSEVKILKFSNHSMWMITC